MVEQFAVRIPWRGADNGGQRYQFPVNQFAEPIGVSQTLGVGSAEHVDDPRVGAPFLVGHTDVSRSAPGHLSYRVLVGERLAADDGGAEPRVEGDELQAGLDVTGYVFDRRQTAPGHDLFDVVRLVEGFFDISVATLPIPDREMLGDWVIRRNIGQRAGYGDRGQRIVGRRLDDRVRPGDHRPQDGHRRDQPAVARRDVENPRSEGTHA